MNYDKVLEHVQHHVKHFFKTQQIEALVYHNLKHTEAVVEHAEDISKHYELHDKDNFVVVAAAWFHDIGYCTGGAQGHEQRGAELAKVYLEEQEVKEEVILAIQGCILATSIPQKPLVFLQQIVCDADLYHLGTDEFVEKNKLMRKEKEMWLGKKIDKKEWRKHTIAFLEAHSYQTDYCRALLDDVKQKNIQRLKDKETEKVKEPEPPINLLKYIDDTKMASEPEEDKDKKGKSDRPEKGIETMFRISSNNHQRLSDMADNKAHIMITTTSIIISVLLSILLRKLEDNAYLIFPTILLLTICVITMVFSILATRPTIPHGTFTEQDITDKKVNLLFFGNFYRMAYSDYAAGMQAMMNDRDFLYGSLTKDVYSQGVVLGRKYRLLRVGYNVFMFGIVASVVSFVIASMFFGK
ncbi:Pycsar system effector family protein [Dyadobacter subterraneus]|uniref:HD domain-containing protein n=1 Tax=Dyadobacter subterraneus TaxID=2773304 RepID=A0ABR9W9Y3_9BACT|nr:Pycsar system effector family protein [Dyadobacter subterraneus]MBE9462283.1 HD domain-containing protein [Dyadobacter subterraneus]